MFQYGHINEGKFSQNCTKINSDIKNFQREVFLTIWWDTYMCLPFGVCFHNFWYIHGWVIIAGRQNCPNFINWCILEKKCVKKHPIQANFVFF